MCNLNVTHPIDPLAYLNLSQVDAIDGTLEAVLPDVKGTSAPCVDYNQLPTVPSLDLDAACRFNTSADRIDSC